MQNLGKEIAVNLIQLPFVLVLLWVVYRRFVSRRPLPRALAVPGNILKVCLLLVVCGLLAGCSDGDPLAQASGPLFPLNAGHWQPTQQQLAAPPNVTDQ